MTFVNLRYHKDEQGIFLIPKRKCLTVFIVNFLITFFFLTYLTYFIFLLVCYS